MWPVDFAGSGLYSQVNNAGEPQWLRVQSRDGGTARPLEPDAGNAAEGSEGPMPDWRFQSCNSLRMAKFLLTTNGATGMSDIDGKAARVAASEAGAERVSMDTNRHEAVAGRGDPGNQGNGEQAATIPTSRDYNFPNSEKVYLSGKIHPDVRVPFREISLAPTKSMSGEIEVNEPVRVYDASGPWGDPDFHGDVTQGLPPLRAKWIRDRGDVETIAGRAVTSADDGYLSVAHARHAQHRNGNSKSLGRNAWHSDAGGQAPNSKEAAIFNLQNANFTRRKILRAKSGAVTQLAYARQGIITPEMEFIAIRENIGREAVARGGDPGLSNGS